MENLTKYGITRSAEELVGFASAGKIQTARTAAKGDLIAGVDIDRAQEELKRKRIELMREKIKEFLLAKLHRHLRMMIQG